MRLVFTVIVLHLLRQKCTAAQGPVCQPQPSCSECLKSPGCAWCEQGGFLNKEDSDERRCDSPDSLHLRKCEPSYVIKPKGEVIYLKNSKLSNNLPNVVQLKPQGLDVKLRIGVPEEFDIEFKRAEGYPIDLYYLMDLSYSMKDDLQKIKTLGRDILNKLKEVTEKVRIGFGSFVDKVKLPYVSQLKSRRKNPCPTRMDTCQPAFTFQNVLPLTDNDKDFTSKVSKQKISGNLDSPEAGLDAIMQAAVCQKEVNWENVTRILVYTSDDTFHMAGDGRLSGIFKPHDEMCHLDSNGFYTASNLDYPSVGQLSRVLQANNIQLIFAVTDNIFPAYKALSALIPQSVVGVLNNDSSNVVQLISEAYGNLSATLLLEQSHTPKGLDVSYISLCREDQPASTKWQRRGECTGIRNEKVKFKVRLNASECLEQTETITIRIQGISESVRVQVKTICECNCKNNEIKSKDCGGNGTLVCGTCSCDPGFLGQSCQCQRDSSSGSFSDLLTHCRKHNTSQPCSGHGSCECTGCRCNGRFSGTYCECDDDSCERHNNKPCNGNGKCQCGKCICNGNFTGSACQCSTDTSMCRQKHGQICSGQGKCKCNLCECNDGFTGPDCSIITNKCQKYQSCMACKIQSDDSDWCNATCSSVTWTKLEGNHQLPCMHSDTHVYDVTLQSAGNVLINYAELPRTIDKTMVIIGTSVSAIILIGIVIIIIYRVLLEVYYRREYHNFLKAQEQNQWKEDTNPLYKKATTTVMNPLHLQD